MKVTLQPLEEVAISGRGETVVYLSGSEPLLISASGKRAEIPSGSQVTLPTFDNVSIQNKGGSAVIAELLIVEGEFRSLAEGSTVKIQSIVDPVEVNEVQRIIETLRADVVNTVTANIANTVDIRQITETLMANVVNTVTANIANTVDIRQITETLSIRQITETIETNVLNTVTAQIDGLVSTQEKAATSLKTSEKIFTAGESFTVPANTNRRDITIFAAETNTGTVAVAGVPLRAGQYVGLDNFIGAVTAQAVAADDKILITEVIK